jgi:nucleoside 2-deoxyribosyltransferase
MQTIYQAGPLFTAAEKHWHKRLSLRLEQAGHAVVWPGDLLTDEEVAAAGDAAPDLIFTACRKAIDGCSCVVALLDGVQVDDGTAWEIGYAYARGLPVYGIRTDFRKAGDAQGSWVNSMIQGALSGFAHSEDELIRLLASSGSAQGHGANRP